MASNERQYRALNCPNFVPRASSIADTSTNHSTAHLLRAHENPYYRRRTTDYLPQPGPGGNVPTIARSSLATSVTINDLSNPTPSLDTPQFSPIKRFTPTRIPSPVWDKTPTGRYVSTPVMPSQKTQKENVQLRTPQGPVSTLDRPANLIPKSRTMGMLSNFTTSFSRSNLSIHDSQEASSPSLHPADVIASDLHYLPVPLFTPNIHQIHASKMNSYWCGRFQSLCDRYHDEQLERLQLFDVDYSPSLPSTPTTISMEKEEYESEGPAEDGGHNFSQSTPTAMEENDDQDKSRSRAFLQLQSLCTTNEARRSLWEFQLHFARIQRKPHLLPRGGKMVDLRSNWLGRVGRVGRAMVGGNNTGFGPRTSMGMGKRKNSMISFLNP